MGLRIDLPATDLLGVTDFQASVLDSNNDGDTLGTASLYVLTGDTDFALNMPTSDLLVVNGAIIKIVNSLDTGITVTINEAVFNGSSQTIEIDTPGINFELIYVNATRGWAIL